MKSKLRNLLLAAMALTLFAGCGNLALNDATFEGSDAGDKCVLTISYSDLEGLLTETPTNRSARTIDPGVFTDAEKSAFTFKIEGKSARNKILKDAEGNTLSSLNFSDGTAQLSLEYDVWYLTLHAYKGTDEVLMGTTTVDLKKGSSSVEFKLSTKGVTTKGEIELTIHGLTDVVKSYKAGLYNVDTDVEVYNLGDANLSTVSTLDAETKVWGDFDLTDFVDENVGENPTNKFVPGSYVFKFIPYNNTVGNDREELTPYSDLITIAPGRKTEETVSISVMERPAAPTGFKASLVKSSEKDAEEDYYTVKLEWVKNAKNNEDNYVLRIYEADAPKEDDPAGTENGKTAVQHFIEDSTNFVEFDKNFQGYNDYWVSGTLGMSTQSCEIKLRTGHLYEFTLAAKNRAGESPVCYRDSSTYDATNETYGGFSKDKRVHRQMIKYVLMGGTYKKDASATGSTAPIIDYRTYGETYSLRTITSPESLVYDNHPFNGWRTKSATGTTASLGSGYDDLIVYANYDTKLTITTDVVPEYMTLGVAVKSPKASDATNAANSTVATLTENKLVLDTTTDVDVWAGVIPLEITSVDADVADAVAKCQKIKVYINGSYVGERADQYSYSCSLNHFKGSGKYQILVIGTFNGKEYSCAPITLDVEVKI